MAQATISITGNVLYELFKDDMKPDQRQQLRKIIDEADVKALLEMQLKLQQAFGQ